MTRTQLVASLLVCLLAAIGCAGDDTGDGSTAGTGAGTLGSAGMLAAGTGAGDGTSGAGVSGEGASGTSAGAAGSGAGTGAGTGSPAPCVGDIDLIAAADIAKVAACTSLMGSLRIASTEITELDLPLLTEVDGDISIGQLTSLTSASFPALVTVTGSVSLDVNKDLTKLSFPMLESVGGLVLRNTYALQTLELPELASAEGGINISYIGISSFENDKITHLAALGIDSCSNLKSISLPALESVEKHVVIGDNRVLASLTLSSLTTVGTFLSVQNARPMQTLSLPKLEDVATGYFEVTGMRDMTKLEVPLLTHVGAWTFSSNPFMFTLGAPKLASVDDMIQIDGNSALSELVFPALTTAGGPVRIEDNTDLPTCAAQAFADQLTGLTQAVTISGNDDAGVCP